MLVDQAHIFVKSGDGGNGSMYSAGRNTFPMAVPMAAMVAVVAMSVCARKPISPA